MKDLGVKTYIYPQPVLIIGTFDDKGNPNVMNAAWGGIADDDMVHICLGEHKTTDNLKINKAFTVGIGDVKNVVACDYVGIVSGRKDAKKFEKSGFSFIKSKYVNAPIICELPITLECEVISFEGCTLFGRIKNVCAREDILGSDGLPDLNKFTPITFDPVHHKYVALGEVVGSAFKDGLKLK